MLWWKLHRLKSKDPKTRRRTVEEMVASEDPSVVEAVAEALQDEDPEVRAAAAKGLGPLRDERAVKPLIAVLRDRRPEVRAAAITSLRQLGDPRAIEAIVNSLEDYDHSVRWQAAGALNTLGWRPGNNTEIMLRSVAMGQHENAAVHGAGAVEILAKALQDPTSPRRHAAATALGKTADPRAVKPLEIALKDEDSHVRVAAVEALCQLGNPQSGTPLLALLGDGDHLVRSAAVEALGRMGDVRVVEAIANGLLQDSSWDVRKLSVEALGRIRDDRATQLLWRALKDADHDVRQTAAHALGQIPDSRSIGPLVLSLKDENSSVRQAAKGALRQIDRQWEISPGAQSVMAELEAAVHDKEYWVAQSAADTLAKINDMRERNLDSDALIDPAAQKLAQGVAILMDTLHDFDRDLRQAAVEALGRLNDFSVIPALVSALDDADEWVGRSAAFALNHLNWAPAPEDVQRVEKMKSLMLRH
jgi:HEAT repeat protein